MGGQEQLLSRSIHTILPMSFPLRKIGDTKVSAIGFGAMGLSGFYGEAVTSDEERFKVSQGLSYPSLLEILNSNLYPRFSMQLLKKDARSGTQRTSIMFVI